MNTMLKLAAKAIGMDYPFIVGAGGRAWNPLDDDGDALRLAVDLFLTIEVDDGFTDVTTDQWFMVREAHDGDAQKATRLAIVKAAASPWRYKNLVAQIRTAGRDNQARLALDAADAIEKLETLVSELESDIDNLRK